jgi:putative toxin-antitoxin system antitoxin component (TIGR02293 family)
MEAQMGRNDIDEPISRTRARGLAGAGLLPYMLEEEQVADGLSSVQLRTIARQICGDAASATKLMHAIVPKSSLSRRGKLTPRQSEQTERLLRLFTLACAAFRDLDDAREFMRRPHPELKNRRPLDAAMTELGGRAVERVLDSLLYGLPV